MEVKINGAKDPSKAGGAQAPGGPNSGNAAPLVPAPIYDLAQFQKDQWIIWVRKVGSSYSCVRWTWTNVGSNANVHQIVAHYSTHSECNEWPEDKVRTIIYDPRSGEVASDRLVVLGQTSSSHKPLVLIYGFVYGYPDPTEFKVGQLPIGDEVYPGFEIEFKEGKVAYLNQPGHPFHAVALNWKIKENGETATYLVYKSFPELPTLPAP